MTTFEWFAAALSIFYRVLVRVVHETLAPTFGVRSHNWRSFA
jgi:hypothetical protein